MYDMAKKYYLKCILCVLMFCLYVYLCTTCVLPANKGYWIPWIWSYKWF